MTIELLSTPVTYIPGWDMNGNSVTVLIVICSFVGFVFAAFGAWTTSKISIDAHASSFAETEVAHPTLDREEKNADTTKPLTQDNKSSSGIGDVEMTHGDGRTVAEQVWIYCATDFGTMYLSCTYETSC